MITYIVAAVVGSTLIKLGGSANMKTIFTIPFVNMHISPVTLLGVLAYGISFLLYIVLLTRFDLSFISPLLVAFVYVLLMFTAWLFFKESFTPLKIVGCSFILIGVIFVILKR